MKFVSLKQLMHSYVIHLLAQEMEFKELGIVRLQK